MHYYKNIKELRNKKKPKSERNSQNARNNTTKLCIMGERKEGATIAPCNHTSGVLWRNIGLLNLK